LVDAFHVSKLLSQQLLPFGRSGDGLGVLTFGVEQFSVLSVPRGRPARTVFVVCSSCSCSSLLSIRCVFEFRLGEVSDGPRVPGRQSAGAWRTVRVLPADGPFNRQSAAQAGQSAVPLRTVRGTLADSPPGSCGQSAPPGRTVRQSLAALLFGSIPPSFFRASACASRNHS
jgi:hypothetical protein